MKKLSIVVAGMLLTAGPAFAQAPAGDKAKDVKKEAAPPAGQMPPSPKPGPEHASLKSLVGTWDATVEMLAPGVPPSKGVETNSAVADGLWIVSDFKAQMGAEPFEGHGVWGYDPVKKKYVGTWVDSMSSSLMLSEGTYDEKTKTATDVMEGRGPDGRPAKWKATTEWKDSDTRVFTMYEAEKPSMRITYKRRK